MIQVNFLLNFVLRLVLLIMVVIAAITSIHTNAEAQCESIPMIPECISLIGSDNDLDEIDDSCECALANYFSPVIHKDPRDRQTELATPEDLLGRSSIALRQITAMWTDCSDNCIYYFKTDPSFG